MPSSQYTKSLLPSAQQIGQPVSSRVRCSMSPSAVAPSPFDQYMELRERWRWNPLLYVQQRFGVEPTQQQTQILDAILPVGAKVSVRSGHGIGKAQPKDLLLDTPLGMRRFGDLRTGDQVFGPDGLPTRILAVSEQGVLPTYRIVFDDMTSTVTCAEHLWTVQGRMERRNDLSTWRLLSTHDLLTYGVKRGNGTNKARQWALPAVSPLYYPAAWVPIEPYTLGYWLGDGTRKTGMITTLDHEPIERIRQVGYEVTRGHWQSHTTTSAAVYYIHGIQRWLRSLELFACHAHTKFVPDIYKYNHPLIRLNVLQGLLDSDGFVDKAGKPMFTTVSLALATDVAWILRSLGAKARVGHPKPGRYRDTKGIVHDVRQSYTVTFACPENLDLFTIQRKKDRYRPTSQKRYVTRWIEAIKPEGLADCQCIRVDRSDGLYLTNDCIVTHNSSSAAWLVSWFVETHDFAKVPCTAPTSRQLRDILWGELSKWRRIADEQSQRRGDHPRFWISTLFRLINDSLIDPMAREWGAFARTAKKETPEALQGFHADHLLFVIDEASGVVEEVFEAAEGALSSPGARVLMLGNPLRNTGTFAASHKHSRGDYTALHFRSQDSPLVDPGYRDRLIRKWGEGSNVVRVRADGDFPRQEDDILISLELTEPCTTREPRQGEGRRRLGVDVARLGADRTTLVLRQGSVVDHVKVYAKQDTMATVGCIVAVLQAWQVDEVDVDVIGLGAGVYDRLEELRRQGQIAVEVVPVNVAEKALPFLHPTDAQPRLLRDQLWLAMAQWLREDAPVFCAEDRGACEDLAGELASVGYGLDSQGHLVVEDKDHIRKRLGHSCDLADGLGCTFSIGNQRRAGVW